MTSQISFCNQEKWIEIKNMYFLLQRASAFFYLSENLIEEVRVKPQFVMPIQHNIVVANVLTNLYKIFYWM